MTPGEDALCVFAVKRGEIEHKELYCNPLYPFYLTLTESFRQSKYCKGTLTDYILVNPKTDCTRLTDKTLVSFVPMPNVQEKSNTVFYDTVPYSQVKKGFTVFHKGDLIWAKITPCMQNGKSCITDQMPTEVGFGSTEFHVIRKRRNDVYMPFIWAILSNDDVLKAARATFSGSAGQQRVSASFIEQFPAVIPNYDIQVALVKELENSLIKLKKERQRATDILDKHEKQVSTMCGFDDTARKVNLCFAIHLKNLDGVIDAKRYSNSKEVQCPQALHSVCNILKDKVNPSSFGKETIDWIRIDDLPNQPLDIETIRTQPADEIEGSFFEVAVGDILVARLGPTILNQKTVMVRETSRRTIASAEFLVLRCKDGINPEAVMAILKTEHYKKLMYSHSRGSTPSRYRLSREDMLTLPFPCITETQDRLADSTQETRVFVAELRNRAEKDWAVAKAQFEKELLGGAE